MDFKYFCWLIIMFLLPKQWRIVGHPTTINFRKEMWNILQNVSPSISGQHYFTLRDFMLDMKDQLDAEINRLKGLCEGHSKERNKWINERNALIDKKTSLERQLIEADKKYGDVCRAIKARDWVLYLERDYFPHWLHYTDVSRYIKWMLALYYGEGHFFDNLRSNLIKDNIDNQTFAAGMHHIYKAASSMYAHNAPDIEKPKQDEADSFCKIFQKDHLPGAVYACKVVIQTNPETSSEKPITGIIPYHTTRLHIVITGIKPVTSTLQTLYVETKMAIEDTPGFKHNNYEITNSHIIPGDPTQTSDHAQREKLDLPSICFILNTKMVLGTTGEEFENTRKYVETKESIRGKLQSLFADKKLKVQILVIEDYRYIKAIAALPLGTVPSTGINPSSLKTESNPIPALLSWKRVSKPAMEIISTPSTDYGGNCTEVYTPDPKDIIDTREDLPWEEQVNVAVRFFDHRLVPELIGLPPRRRCHAWFSGLLAPVRMIIGAEMKRSDMFDPPLNMSWKYIPNHLYTVFLTTPDFTLSSNFTNWRQLHQWLIINVKNCNINTGDTVLEYLLPQVVRKAGFTRYAFLVYEQPGRLQVPKIKRNGLNVTFTIKQYVQKFKLGNPKFGNYFFVYFE